MVKLDNTPFLEALKRHKKERQIPEAVIIGNANSSRGTMKKLERGAVDQNLAAIDRLADYLGLDTVVTFVPKVPIAPKTNGKKLLRRKK